MEFSARPTVLTDSRLHGPGSGAELFVVEGESAAGAVTRVRDPALQAVLPLRGKPLNSLRAGPRRVADHPFYAALATALRTPIGGPFERPRVPFDRVVVLMDPDADGIHCGALVIAFLARWMRPLVDDGLVRIVRPPWGERVTEDGTRVALAWSESELRTPDAGTVARRFRGLAAIDGATLATTCVASATRREELVDAAGIAEVMRLLGPSPGR
ncbi:MAG: toprim domain-containing protein [Planctomycetaceae bacterium]